MKGGPVKIIWTSHADDRVREWHRRKGVTRELVEEVLRKPEQVVPGDLNTLVAQRRWLGGLLRVPFGEVQEGRKVLTVYWTSRTARYWREPT